MEWKNLTFEVDAAGIGLATLDMPGRPFNVFSDDMIDEIEALIEHVEQNTATIKGVVFASGKDAFMAGADLAMVRGFTTLRHRAARPEIRATFSRLSYLMRRLERLTVPTVAAVNGLALGGGLELAMACHHRVAAHVDQACLGLPEVLLGLLPGAGGTQRLPRLTSPAFGARMLMDGKPVTPAVAHEAGLIDHLAEPEQLIESAHALALRAAPGARWDKPDWQAPGDAEGVLAGTDAEARLCALGWVDPAVAHCYPAFGAIARCLLDGYGKPDIDSAMEVEFDNFETLMLDAVAGSMVRTSFLSKTAAPKRAAAVLGKAEVPRQIAWQGGAAVPERIARRLTCVETAAEAELVLGDADGSTTDTLLTACLVEAREAGATGGPEMRYAGEFERSEGVELAVAPGELATRMLGLANRLRLVPVAASGQDARPAARLIEVVRAWCETHAAEPARRGALAAALDLGTLFDAAGLEHEGTGQFEPGDRALGLELLVAVAVEAAACLADGSLAGPEDVDLLAVFVTGFPAWGGGPLTLLDNIARGEIADAPALPAGLATPYYVD